MLAVPLTTLRVLAAHWPALVAWFLAGYLGRYIAIEFAGFVGGYTATGGMLLLPLAILARLVSMVAMFLVVRDSLRELQRIAPLPEERRERRKTFADATLAAVLPFFAVYAAWGFLREDVRAYEFRALEVRRGVDVQSIFAGEEISDVGAGTNLTFSVLTVSIIVVAFALRWAWKRWGTRLPKAFAIGAVYLEAVWVFFSLILLGQAIDAVRGFIDSRVAMVWLAEMRQWVAERLTPVSWLWDGIEWFLGEAGGILLLPLAWLTLAGVVYGQAISPERLRIEHSVVATARKGWTRVPAMLQKRLRDLGLELTSRFRPIGRALLLMWRAGPVPVAVYVLLYTLLLAGESLLRLGLVRAFGPQDLFAFWSVADTLVFTAIPLVIEPIRIALIAGAYDVTLRVLRNNRRRAQDDEATGGASADAEDQKSSVPNLKNLGTAETGESSTQNGPEASAGTT